MDVVLYKLVFYCFDVAAAIGGVWGVEGKGRERGEEEVRQGETGSWASGTALEQTRAADKGWRRGESGKRKEEDLAESDRSRGRRQRQMEERLGDFC